MHLPVLLQETIEGLDLSPGLVVVDATVGVGGHSEAIGRVIGPTGHLIAFDRDIEAIQAVENKFRQFDCQTSLRQGNFRHLDSLLDSLGITVVDRILFDLGFSSDQLLNGRGFSFNLDEPLLMTYEVSSNPDQLTAREIVNNWSAVELEEIFERYGEEVFTKPIVKAIVAKRRRQSIETSGQLVAIIESAVPAWYRSPRRHRHFATLIFQALRIAVNDEFKAIEAGLVIGFERLSIGGRLAIITFHSGEARLVKNFFREMVKADKGSIVAKAIRTPWSEIKTNPRARSAVLRIIKKL